MRLAEVEECRVITKVNIENLTQVKKEFLEEHLLKPSKLINTTQHFVKCTTQEFHQEVSTKVCDGELVIEKMKSRKLEAIMKNSSLWEEYQDQM